MDRTDLSKEKKSRSLHSRAHQYASKHKLDAPSTWNEAERNTYWWGLYDGYHAGVRAQQRKRK